VPGVIESLDAIKSLAVDMRSVLERGDIDVVGELLDQGWQLKKALAESISNDFIDECYAIARGRGALGGKITGAGGGGFLLFYCPRRHQSAVRSALTARGLVQMDFQLEQHGTQVLLHAMIPDVDSLRSTGSDQVNRRHHDEATPSTRRNDRIKSRREPTHNAVGGAKAYIT
jgi:hypothetical protein